MDEVFGPENFVSQISYKSTAGLGSRYLAASANFILWYAKSFDALKFRQIWESKTAEDPGAALYSRIRFPDGSYRTMTKAEVLGMEAIPENARRFRPDNLISQRPPQGGDLRFFDYEGKRYTPGKGVFKTDLSGLVRLGLANRLWPTSGGTLQYIRMLDDFPAMAPSNVWTDTGTGSFTDEKVYVVQTGAKIIQRCMLMCTDPGDLVLDPTCGSGTTAFVAEQWGRRWITIDTSRVALALARQRLMGAKYPMYLLADSDKGKLKEAEVSQHPRVGGPSTTDIRHGFVYERVQHVTLKSIANNPDIVEGMSRDEIDAAIKRHADFETLYDRPYEDKNAVRVSGPFTVESLSPHRSLAFAGGPEVAVESATERAGEEQPDAPQFEVSILENLAKAGIQNGLKGERIELESLEPYAGQYIQAVARQKVADGNGGGEGRSALRVGIALGPQYGTVSQRFAASAVKEAVAAQDIDLVCVLGFAFDAQAADVTEADGVTVETSRTGFAEVADERLYGRIKMLLVRMNVDLLMGEDLKKTGAGNLFTVFGEPDLEIRRDGDDVVVELHGVDVYDPTTGEVRSRDTDRIALWMIDTDYNGDSFFVRHCYFTGGGDPYKRLKTALKAEIDADAWSQLYGTVSHPFAAPSTGKIAVKVINDYGDEVMKVFEVQS